MSENQQQDQGFNFGFGPAPAPVEQQAQPSPAAPDDSPAQFNRTNTKYHTMTRAVDGDAYDKTGKALGPFDESSQSAPAQPQAPQQGNGFDFQFTAQPSE